MLTTRIDATSIAPGKSAGVEMFAYGLIGALHRRQGAAELSLLVRAGDKSAWLRGVGESVNLDEVPVLLDAQSRLQTLLRRYLPAAVRRSRGVRVVRHIRATSVSRRSLTHSGLTYYPFHRSYVTADRSVVTAHDFRVFESGFTSQIDQALISRNLELASAIICSWPHPYDDAHRLFPQHADKLFLVPLPVFNAPSTTARPIEPGGPLLYPASTAPHKNHARLLESVARIPGVRLTCAGPLAEPWASQLKEQARRLGIDDRVVFPGFVSDTSLNQLFANCSAVVVPTLWEAASGPVFEALAWKKPVIASDIEPIRSQLRLVGGQADLFDPLDVTDMSAVIRRTIDNLEQRTRTAATFEMWLTRRTWDQVADDYLRVFHWADGGGGKPVDLQPERRLAS